MNLLEEIQDARNEFLQEAWDRHLIESWMKFGDANIGKSIGSFKKKYNLNDDQVFSLKRTPKTKIQFTTSATRFIAAYLPVLNTHLWNGEKDIDRLAKICAKYDSLKYPADDRKVQSDTKELRRSKIKYEKSMMERKIDHVVYEEQKRSNWGVSKPKGKAK